MQISRAEVLTGSGSYLPSTSCIMYNCFIPLFNRATLVWVFHYLTLPKQFLCIYLMHRNARSIIYPVIPDIVTSTVIIYLFGSMIKSAISNLSYTENLWYASLNHWLQTMNLPLNYFPNIRLKFQIVLIFYHFFKFYNGKIYIMPFIDESLYWPFHQNAMHTHIYHPHMIEYP